MKSPEIQDVNGTFSSAQGELVGRYERIGISAVAGALACEKAAGKKEPAAIEQGIKERELQVSA